MADASSWDSTIPSGSSEIRKGDDLLRSHWSILEATWEQEHFFAADNSGASAGIHRPGSSRVSFGDFTAPAAGDEGRMFYRASDHNLIIQGPSTNTNLVHGGIRAKASLSADSNVGATGPQGAIEFGTQDYDQNDMFTAGDSRFTAPVDGEYEMLLQVAWEDDQQTNNINYVIRDADDNTRHYGSLVVDDPARRVQVHAIARLSAGSTVQASITSAPNSNITFKAPGSDEVGTYFAIHQI